MNYYTDALQKYSDFQTRTSRKAYWMFVLFNFIIAIGISFIANLLNVRALPNLYSLVLFIPSLAISVRRLHDINKGGAYLLFILLPIIGWLYLFILLVQKGDQGTNNYGPNPELSDNDSNKTDSDDVKPNEELKPLN